MDIGKIRKVEIWITRSTLSEDGWSKVKSFLFVRTTNSDGVEGWGEAFVLPYREKGVAELIFSLVSSINEIECKININNISELHYVRSLLKSNILIQNLILKGIELNNNLYSILFIGDMKNFKDSLKSKRLNLFYQNNLCNIELL